ncbi:DUF7287 family protein [Methanococcoides burtonii]|uniref:Uncharacterized protein n=1 Tax=Methanococcoides burtonii (strain DSM 6242 / NBRC 107633 / OCM 468 / ACE-M) TaxID=259564 RepID=Q12VY3_METBU|nr:hypothetical protein [Methanococcoides burtonii]ABE52393.1 Hypothetical protein Mbur_1486 [Methanococcoides burtonii DSM 6242]
MDDRGQVALDFLFGMALFLVAFTFTMQFVPGLFVSDSTDETGIAFTAYRTATILSEDPGWWENSTQRGTDWEDHVSNATRIGLAVDTVPETRLTDTINLLSMDKSLQLMYLDEDTLITKLGLYDNINGKHIRYGYNISLHRDGNPILLNDTLFVRGEINTDSVDVFKIERLALVETGTFVDYDANSLYSNGTADTTRISISESQKGKMVIDINNFTTTSPNSSFENISMDGTLLNSSNDYVVYLKNSSNGFEPYSPPIMSNNMLRLEIYPMAFENSSLVEIEFDDVTFISGPAVEYTASKEPFYELAQMMVKVWK